MTALAGWVNFYVIVGSSAGALIGLQFVVIALVANRPIAPTQGASAGAYATPTVVHFGSVLLLSAIATVPWQSFWGPVLTWGSLGLVGMVYEVIVIGRMRTQSLYKAVFEDWLFHALLPLVAYAILAVSAVLAVSSLETRPNSQDVWLAAPAFSDAHALSGAQCALFGVAGAALLLLFIGIHNAWDAVTYHVFTPPKREPE
jgi:hypothetical protein